MPAAYQQQLPQTDPEQNGFESDLPPASGRRSRALMGALLVGIAFVGGLVCMGRARSALGGGPKVAEFSSTLVLAQDFTNMPSSYFRAWSAEDETLDKNTKEAFNHFITKSGFGDELEPEELEAFKARFEDDVSRLVQAKSFLDLENPEAKGVWRDILKEAFAEEKPAVTKAFVDDINSKHLGFTVRKSGWMQNYSHLDLEHKLGVVVPPGDHELSEKALRRLSETARRVEQVPTSFDSRDKWPKCKDVFVRPHSQGACKSCWAFAGLLVTDSRLCIATGGKFSGSKAMLSRTVAATCGKDAALGDDHDACRSGGHSVWIFDYVTKSGVPTGGDLGCMPYFGHGDGKDHFDVQGEAPPCPSRCGSHYSRAFDSDLFRLNSEYRSDSYTLQYNTHWHRFKQTIFETGPVVAYVYANAAFMAYSSGVFQAGCHQSINHAVVIIGWGEESGREFYSLVNSWGQTEPSMRVAPCVVQSVIVPGEIDLSSTSMPSPVFDSSVSEGWATCAGDANGAPCKFPFEYKGKTHSACTKENHHTEWCYTDDDKHFGHCNCPSTCGGDANGAPCKFPFEYKGKKHSACTSAGYHTDWCYTDDDEHFGHCDCN